MSAGGKQSTGRMTLASHSSFISRFTALFGPVSQKRRELPCASILCVPSKPSPLKKAKSRSPVQFPKNVSAGKSGLKDQFPLLSPKLPLNVPILSEDRTNCIEVIGQDSTKKTVE